MKCALITGAAGGLGGACVRALTAVGWTVFAADLDGAAITMDVTNQDSIDAAKQVIKQTTNTLDAVINFAGVHTMGSMIEGDIAQAIEKLLAVNLMGMVRVNRTFFDMLEPGRGRIINCSSECGYLKAQPFNGPYTVSKYAVEAYSDSLHRELLGLGIKVIKIQPGSFKTNMLATTLAGYDQLFATTEHHKKTLTTMQPLMTRELQHANDPTLIGKVVCRAATCRWPRNNYRVRNSGLLRLLQFVPDPILDAAYKAMMK